MLVNVQGRVKNTNLPKAQALLPLFEAVFNSIQAIVEANEPHGLIEIFIQRDFSGKTLNFLNDSSSKENSHYPILGFDVVDNGIGFNDANFDSFNTSDSMLKSSQGNKGVGRFMWLKAFEEVAINSTYKVGNEYFDRSFIFCLCDSGIENHKSMLSSDERSRTKIALKKFKTDYRDNCPKTVVAIARRLLEHILIHFINDKVPQITIHDLPETISLNDLFREEIAKNVSTTEFEIKANRFEIKFVKASSTPDGEHTLHLCAQGRDVKSYKLKKYHTDFSKKFEDENGKGFVISGFVTGEFLESNVNHERTNFNIPEEDDSLFLGMEDIVKSSAHKAIEFSKDNIAKVQVSRISAIREFVVNKAPEYRLLLNEKHLHYLTHISATITDDKLEIELHKALRQIEIDVKQRSRDILTVNQLDNPDELANYRMEYERFIEDVNEVGKANLANYIAHRRIIIELFENSLKRQASGKYPLEASVHKIIHPLISTSEETGFYQQNLWLIDERLAYHAFLASDKPFSATDFLSVDSQKEPDIICNFFFESALAFTEDISDQQSVVIIEFKRPGRTSYSQENPIEQVINYAKLVRNGNAKDKDGRLIPGKNVPIYAYIICDLTQDFREIIEVFDFSEMYDGEGFYSYHKATRTYIEIVSFGKLVRDAKKRNRVLFEKLNLPPV